MATATCGKGQTAALAVAGAERRKRIKPSIEGKSLDPSWKYILIQRVALNSTSPNQGLER